MQLDWRGSAEDLVRAAWRELALRRHSSDAVEWHELSVRLLRDYMRRGIVSRPLKEGRRAVFGARQLLELIAARLLVADGWPLKKIAENLQHMSNDELLSFLDGRSGEKQVSRPPTPDVDDDDPGILRAGMVYFGPETPEFASQEEESGFVDEFSRRMKQISTIRSELKEALRRLDVTEDEAPSRDVVLIDLSPWCSVLINRDRLEHLTVDQAEDLGRVLKGRLVRNRPPNPTTGRQSAGWKR